jgi:hypothetical protein
MSGLTHISELGPSEDGGLPNILAYPPYYSQSELIFDETCFKHLHSKVTAEKQKEIITQYGTFYLDFLLTFEDERIAVECSGNDSSEQFRDEFRDAIILGEGYCETIYHFRDNDLKYYSEDCIWLMSLLDPKLFSRRGHIHLDILHHLDFKIDNRSENILQVVNDGRKDDEGYPYHFWAFRRSVHLLTLPNPLKYHWKSLYQFACENQGLDLNELYDLETQNWNLK